MNYYFAYGSNMDPDQMEKRCPAAVRVTRASLSGYRFLINTRGVATLHKEKGAIVYGLIYRITPECERSLDKFEGVVKGLYGKHLAQCHSLRRRALRVCLTYIDPDPYTGPARPGYMDKILRGAYLAQLPTPYIRQLNRWRFHVA